MSSEPNTVRNYVMNRYASEIAEAEKFVRQAEAALHRPPFETPTPEDWRLAEALLRSAPHLADRLATCQDRLQAAAWLPDRPTLADIVVDERLVTREQIEKLLAAPDEASEQASGKPSSKRSDRPQNINVHYANAAIRLGFVPREKAAAALASIPASEKKLRVAGVLVQQGCLTLQQHQSVMANLRSYLPITDGKAPEMPREGK